jgi:hypothetical protein
MMALDEIPVSGCTYTHRKPQTYIKTQHPQANKYILLKKLETNDEKPTMRCVLTCFNTL